MKPTRRYFLYAASSAVGACVLPRMVWGQSYPTRSIRLVVGAPPGGPLDILGRLIGQWLSERLEQPVVIENHVGAGANVGTAVVVRSPADGYTLLLVATSMAVNATLYANLPFNFIRDIAPIAGISRTPLVMVVNASFPATNIPEFIAYAKANSGKLNMASAGIGTPNHVAGELFKMMTGVAMVHVPYRGNVAALLDLIEGRVHVAFDSPSTSIEHIKAGRLRALGVTTASRSEFLPELPTVGEFVPGFEASAWFGLGAPKNTPPEIIDRLNREVNVGLAAPRIKDRLARLGSTVLSGSPADFGKLIAEDTEKWAKVVKFSGAKAH